MDAGGNDVTVTLSVTQGILTVTAGNSGVNSVSGSPSSTITITGTITEINDLLGGIDTGIGSAGTIVYNANVDNPGASATLILQVNDNGNTGAGGPQTTSDTATINIAAVNDAPATDLNGGAGGTGNNPSFTEQTPVLIAPAGVITDPDSANLQSMTVTLTSRPNGDAVESLSLNAAAGTAASGAGVSVGYTAATGVLLLSGSASVAVYQSILQGILYNNSSDAPNTANRSVTVVVNDGAATSASNTSTISVAAVNDAPTATITPASYNATEQTNLTLHGTGLSIADVDAGGNDVTVTLSVTQGILTIAAGNSGVNSVSGSGTSSVTITGTITEINNLLGGIDTGPGSAGTIVYNANVDNPPSSATLTLLVDDTGDLGAGGPLTASDTATINIAPVNDAPAVSVDGAASYTVGGAAVVLNSTITITDPDNTTLASATVTITNFQSGDALNFTAVPATMGNIAIQSNVSGVLTLTSAGNTATLAQWEAALEAVSFSTTSSVTTTRTVSFVINDGLTNSPADTATVSVTVPTFAPYIVEPDILYWSGDATGDQTPINRISFQDQDSVASTVRVTLSMDDTGDALSAATGGGVTVVSGSGTRGARSRRHDSGHQRVLVRGRRAVEPGREQQRRDGHADGHDRRQRLGGRRQCRLDDRQHLGDQPQLYRWRNRQQHERLLECEPQRHRHRAGRLCRDRRWQRHHDHLLVASAVEHDRDLQRRRQRHRHGDSGLYARPACRNSREHQRPERP